ncbi:MAG: tRNA (pseudouridine(54)-N(1))-methyltransferase TrmY [Thermoplasmata archaeon]|nr:tRNA (pseudouridine(54)-N(1))-methyltransferase TrmY [Thermoplasmata archaeon]
MPAFIVIGRKVCTDGRFSLNDLTGSTGRLDILLRCINSSFMLSNDIRRDIDLYLVLQGEPDAPKTLLLRGSELKYLNPDERATASLVKNALMQKNITEEWRKSTPGIMIARLDFPSLLKQLENRRIVYLKEEGQSLNDAELSMDDVFVLGGKEDISAQEEELISKWPDTLKISLGPKSLHADHCITVALNALDNLI